MTTKPTFAIKANHTLCECSHARGSHDFSRGRYRGCSHGWRGGNTGCSCVHYRKPPLPKPTEKCRNCGHQLRHHKNGNCNQPGHSSYGSRGTTMCPCMTFRSRKP